MAEEKDAGQEKSQPPGNSAPQDNPKPATPIEKAVVKVGDWFSIRILTLVAVSSTLVTIIIWLFLAEYSIISYFMIKPLETKLVDTKHELSKVEELADRLQKELSLTKDDYNKLLKRDDIPVLLSPEDGEAVFGQHVVFTWDYSGHRDGQRYILELRHLSDPDSRPLQYNVADSQAKRMHFKLNHFGDYIWRVYPGPDSPEAKVYQYPWSRWSRFRAYRNVLDRIRSTGRLRVATYPTYYGSFNVMDGKGGYRGFEIDLINWIAEKIAKELGIEDGIEIVMLDRGWDEMFLAVESREADLAISTISRMLSREKKYPRLRFSSGYFTVHQVFISADPGKIFPDDLKGKIVGVSTESTNFEAAKYLKDRFKYDIEPIDSPSYGDLFNHMKQGKIDFCLVDNTATLGYQFSGWLDDYLTEFNQDKFGTDREEYALAIPYETDEKQSLQNMVNGLLQSDECKNFLKGLRMRYKLEPEKTSPPQ